MTDMGWRTSPFVIGQQYKATKDFDSVFSHFAANETLVFEKEQYSHYDGASVYTFRNSLNNDTKEWWLRDEQSLELWQDYFKPI